MISLKPQQVSKTLQAFYQKPVARVSSELVFSILAILLFAMFAIRPTLLTMSNLIKEVDDKQKLSDALTQKIAALSSVQAQYQDNTSQLAVLDQAIPATPQMSLAVTMIEKAASDRQLLITEIHAAEVPREDSTATGSAEKKLVLKPLVVTVQGDFPTIRNFLTDLTTLRRVFVIDSVVFNLADSRGQKALRAVITINVTYFGGAP